MEFLIGSTWFNRVISHQFSRHWIHPQTTIAFRGLTNQSRTTLNQSRIFIKDSLKELNALQEKSEVVKANITMLHNLLTKIESVGLEADSPLVDEIFNAVELVGKSFDDDSGIAESHDPKSDIRESPFKISRKIVTSFTRSNDKNFSKLFENLTISLSEMQRQSESTLIDWYARFEEATTTE